MKLSLLFSAALLISSCAHPQGGHSATPERSFASTHETHFGHSHKHGKDCGHETQTVGTDTVYKHDGHLHKVHGDHVDEISAN